MKILVIDDEPQIRQTLQIGLEHNDYRVVTCASGEEGLEAAAGGVFDFVILDLAMPGMDGVQVCRHLRSWNTVPIIVLSVRDGENDKIAALDAGADDYLTKPFSVNELLARLRAISRRLNSDTERELSTLSTNDLTIDFVKRRVVLADTELHLTPIEFHLLKLLAQHPNRVFTYQQLLTEVWGPEYARDTHTLRVHIANLRNKIEADSTRPRYLHTEPRIGYRFRLDSSHST